MRILFGAAAVTAGIALAGAGCNFQTYKAAPLAPQATAARYARRSLDAPGLRAYLSRALGRAPAPWPPRAWTPRRLTLAALYYNPSLAAARAGIPLARAGLLTAAERPNPVLTFGPGLTTFPNPWALRLAALFPWELGGKRPARMRVARREISLARLRTAQEAWRVRAQLRAALLGLAAARRQTALLQAQARSEARQAHLLRQRYAAGEIARPAYVRAKRSWLQARLTLARAQGAQAQARVALAAAIGVPASGLRGIRLAWPGWRHPPSPAQLRPARLKQLAELNRLDLRIALAQYAVAEARLREQIALQYPNLNLGPGYSYEEAHSVFRVAMTLTLPAFNHNQGPIAQALARRNQLAAEFIALQARDRAAAANAWAGYRAAWRSWRLATGDYRLALAQRQLARQAQRQGETGQLRYATARLRTELSAETRWRALARTQAALGALENAVERPIKRKRSAVSGQR